MLDRIAESLFWIGRYAERAENHARLLDVYYHVRDEGDTGEAGVLKRIVEAIGSCQQYESLYDAYEERNVLQFLALDVSQMNSLYCCVSLARDNLKKIREQLPAELWNLLNGYYLWLKGVTIEQVMEMTPHRFFQKIKEGLSSFQGTAVSITLRDESWHMLEAGRYLERSENIVRLMQSLRQTLSDPRLTTYGYMLAILKSVGGAEAFRRLDIPEMTLEEVVRFLVLEETFPRSVQFSLVSFESHLRALRSPGGRTGASLEKMLRLAGKTRSELGYLERQEVTLGNLDNVLHQLSLSNRQLGETMARTFFSPGREVTA